MVLSNKARFIKEQCDDVIDLRKKKKQQVIELLQSRNYDVIDQDNDYKYLRTMTIDSVEEENVAKLIAEKEKKQKDDKMTSSLTAKVFLALFLQLLLSFKT